MTDTDRPTDPHGSEPPSEPEPRGSHLLTAIGNLIDDKLTAIDEKLETINDAVTVAAQVREQLSRFNANFEELRHEIRLLKDRMSVSETRLSDLEGKQ